MAKSKAMKSSAKTSGGRSSPAQRTSRRLKAEGLRSRETSDTVSQRQFETLGNGQTLDLLKDSREAHEETQRRERNGEQIGKTFNNTRGAFVGADDSKPDAKEFDLKPSAELKKRDEQSVSMQQRIEHERIIQPQMLQTEEAGQIERLGQTPEQIESTSALNERREETQARGR